MNKDNEIELVQTIQEKDRKIKELEERVKELELMYGNTKRELIARTDKYIELLARTDELSEVLEKLKDRVPKDKIKIKFKSIINYFERMGTADEDISYLKLKEQELLLKEKQI